MRFVKVIKDLNELCDIGVTDEDDRLKILKEICSLRGAMDENDQRLVYAYSTASF